MDSRDFPVSARIQLPDKNVRPIAFLKSLHSSPLIPPGLDSRELHKIFGGIPDGFSPTEAITEGVPKNSFIY
jgi:hypothetical protein